VHQITGVREASQNVFVCDPWIAIEDLGFGLASGEQIEDELYRDTRSPDQWFAGEDVRVCGNTFRPRHP